jgi:thymidylate kinase
MIEHQYKMLYFFGPDGTGKTTHADLVSFYLNDRGLKTWRTSVKQHHTLSFLLLKLLTYNSPKGQAMSYYGFYGDLAKKIKTPWKILELLSLLPALFYRIYLPLFLGYIVICDRYLFDTIVTLSFFLKEPKIISGLSVKLLVKLIPKNSLLIHFEADSAVILQRKSDEPLTKQLIEYYKNAYRNVIKWSGREIITIDTSISSVKEVQSNILSLMCRIR